MIELDYPLDGKYLIRKKKSIKRTLLEKKGVARIQKKIAILGGSTTNEIADQLELFLLNHGIEPIFYQSEYNQFWQDAVFGNKELDEFNPDVIYFHTSWRNLNYLPTLESSRSEVEEALNIEFSRIKQMWDAVSYRYDCAIIQNNFDRPAWRLLGNRDIVDYRGKTNFIYRLNCRIYDYIQEHESIYLNDIDYLAAAYGLEEWSNPLYWHMYKYSLCIDAIPSLAKNIADIIKSIYGKNKKFLALDLDNTLWGGVIGDDGVEGIKIGEETSLGQVYSEFQEYLKELKNLGVLLTINSKNDESNALEGLNHPFGTLKEQDFVVIKANWDNKNINIENIASELNLGTDTCVFVDDNPVEREIVSKNLPEVVVPIMDKIENYIRILDRSGYFENTSLSNDDLKRNEMYTVNKKRELMRDKVETYEEFLAALKMKATISDFDSLAIPRISQLTNKSNQFNLTTLRCSEADIKVFGESDKYIDIYGRLEDKFGDNGIVSVVIGEVEETVLHVRLWLMSCRVLKRGMEDAMMDTLIDKAQKRGIEKIYGYYYPTKKNMMVSMFYKNYGFAMVDDNNGNTSWMLEVSSYQKRNKFIELKNIKEDE